MKSFIQAFKFLVESVAEMLPWMVILNSVFLARRVYFADISAQIPAAIFVALTNFLMFIWIVLKPFESVCQSWILNIVRNILPVEMFLFSFFAERYFILSVIIGLLTIAGPIVTYNLMLRWGKNASNPYAYKRACRLTAQKHYLVLAMLILLVPTVVGIQKKDEPYAEAKLTAEVFGEAVAEKEEIDLVEENNAILSYLEESRWQKLNKAERMNLLQTVVNIECTRFGIAPVQIVGDKLSDGTLGAYSRDENIIRIDIEVLVDSPSADCIRTVGHEVRHAYQHSVVEAINWEDEAVQTSYYFAPARSWKDAFDNYVTGSENFEAYYNLSVESDAREYGTICEKIIYAEYINPPEPTQGQE